MKGGRERRRINACDTAGTPPMTERILVVEDSRFFTSVLSDSLSVRPGIEVVAAASRAEAEQRLAEMEADRPLCLVDLNLPDAADGEVARDLVRRGLPVVVFTSSYDRRLRDALFRDGIIDYVLKESPASVGYLADLVERIFRNRETTALVVEDSEPIRALVTRQLEGQNIRVLTAANGEAALATLAEQGGVRLVLTDYHMPGLDGFELVRRLRREHTKDELCVIGMSSTEEDDISVRFLKYGANDFLHKPFTAEELLCRVTQNLDMLDLIDDLRRAAVTDALTGLWNRRQLLEAGRKTLARARRDDSPLQVAMIDIDFFKRVNDRHGHEAGDAVLRALAGILRNGVREGDLAARMGGEEFCVLTAGQPPDRAAILHERLRATIEATPVATRDGEVRVTASIGVCARPLDTLEDMIRAADEALYAAKEGGRNRIVMADIDPDAAG
jgi:diguanylate cyclase (GGDEF)-like protein